MSTALAPTPTSPDTINKSLAEIKSAWPETTEVTEAERDGEAVPQIANLAAEGDTMANIERMQRKVAPTSAVAVPNLAAAKRDTAEKGEEEEAQSALVQVDVSAAAETAKAGATATVTTSLIDTREEGGNGKQLRSVSIKEVALHNKPDDLWIVVDSEVFDVTGFRAVHPGGDKILLGVAGKDATKKFLKYHHLRLLRRYKDDLQIGIVVEDVQGGAKEHPSASRLRSRLAKWKR